MTPLTKGFEFVDYGRPQRLGSCAVNRLYGQSLAFALRICLSSSGTVGSSFFGLGLFSGFGSFVVGLGFGCSGSRTVGYRRV